MKHLLLGAICCCLLSWSNASGQTQPDSIITTKGAVTLITCGSAISTFQIGDGKNSDYDYRIVDGNVVFIRPVVATPRPTNLVIREGNNIFYMILAYQEKAELSKLKYNLAGGGAASKPASTVSQDTKPADVPTSDPAADNTPAPDIDTVTVGNIAADFIKQRKSGHQYEATADEVTVTYSQAMTLNNLMYICFRVRNDAFKPFQLSTATLMHKVRTKDSATLKNLPIAYKKGPMTFDVKAEENIVFVTSAPIFKKNDELLFVMYNAVTKNQVMLYVPVSALPKYMVTK